MKKTLFLVCSIACALCSCITEPPVVPESYLNFKVDGTEYTFHIGQFSAWSPAAGFYNLRSPSIYGLGPPPESDFPYWFDIRETSTGENCGILIPKEFQLQYVENLDSCYFPIPPTDLNGIPLSMEEVFYYENGTITYSKNDCGNRDYFDFSCLCTYDVLMCDLKGTFHLTFKNGLGDSITLADGNFLMIGVTQ